MLEKGRARTVVSGGLARVDQSSGVMAGLSFSDRVQAAGFINPSKARHQKSSRDTLLSEYVEFGIWFAKELIFFARKQPSLFSKRKLEHLLIETLSEQIILIYIIISFLIYY